MEKIEKTTVNSTEVRKGLMEYLSRFGEVVEDDIVNLKKELPENIHKAFDNLPEERKIIFTAIHKLSQEELEGLFNLSQKGSTNSKLTFAFHDINGAFQFLLQTNNPKYEFFSKYKKE